MLFAGKWVKLYTIMLNEISQTQKKNTTFLFMYGI
jgi:hypothetical protein